MSDNTRQPTLNPHATLKQQLQLARFDPARTQINRYGHAWLASCTLIVLLRWDALSDESLSGACLLPAMVRYPFSRSFLSKVSIKLILLHHDGL
jgi:hypothetical protein